MKRYKNPKKKKKKLGRKNGREKKKKIKEAAKIQEVKNFRMIKMDYFIFKNSIDKNNCMCRKWKENLFQ